MLYSFAFVLDPRAKLRDFHKALSIIPNLNDNDYANYYDSVRSELTTVFTKYDLRFGGQVSHQKQVPAAGSGKKRKAWGKIYGSDAVGGVSDLSSTPEPSLMFDSQSELLA
jgi:hypothetical protein